MPIREYHCTECGHEFEVLEGPSSETPKCEACGAEKLERLLSVFAPQSGRGSDAGPPPACGDYRPERELSVGGVKQAHVSLNSFDFRRQDAKTVQ